ncbi:Hsp20/alpha crystallin family protein [Noviherbaspirillum sp.]|uniref:Hsp20/alpha crystallin family protein n=1 Tax=Noviherbaspirillum sp. TaxID=1926288 RepID=UPI0025EC37BD|nr:Hsp20/alpha crystallin family protein [Noviherbaspirillum sp.]HJV51046.1 Hsp20/alpha crystallin family protein [Noviherbaspirillum sp.]
MRWRDPTASMWDEALELLEHADRLHRQFFQLENRRSQSPAWQPPVDIFETEWEVVVFVALPGVAAEQLEVSVDGTAVIVRGQRAMPGICRSGAIRRLEIPYGRFERRIEFPAQRFQLGQRLLKDGCLMLTLQKTG